MLIPRFLASRVPSLYILCCKYFFSALRPIATTAEYLLNCASSCLFYPSPLLIACRDWRSTGDDRGGHFTPFGSVLAWRAHVAHRARPRDRHFPRRPLDRRGDAQPRWPALDRPAVRRPGG